MSQRARKGLGEYQCKTKALLRKEPNVPKDPPGKESYQNRPNPHQEVTKKILRGIYAFDKIHLPLWSTNDRCCIPVPPQSHQSPC